MFSGLVREVVDSLVGLGVIFFDSFFFMVFYFEFFLDLIFLVRGCVFWVWLFVSCWGKRDFG